MKPIPDLLPDLTIEQSKRIFWRHLCHERHNPTKDEARNLFEQLHPILCNVDNWRRFIVASYVTGLPMSVKTATDYLRAEVDCKDTLTLDPE